MKRTYRIEVSEHDPDSKVGRVARNVVKLAARHMQQELDRVVIGIKVSLSHDDAVEPVGVKGKRGGPITLNSKSGVLVRYTSGLMSSLKFKTGRTTGHTKNGTMIGVMFDDGEYFCYPESLERVKITR